MATTYSSMSAFIMAVSEQYRLAYGFCIKDLDKITKKTAGELETAIRRDAPVGKTGKYRASWDIVGERNNSGALDFTVYSKDRYMLTHLLEFKHFAGRDYHVVEGHPHIGKNVEMYNSIYIDRIEKAFAAFGG